MKTQLMDVQLLNFLTTENKLKLLDLVDKFDLDLEVIEFIKECYCYQGHNYSEDISQAQKLRANLSDIQDIIDSAIGDLREASSDLEDLL